MTDQEFMADLEACHLPVEAFDHTAHVRIGYLYLREATFAPAVARMSATIKRYAHSLGKTGLYHETITIGFMALIQERLSERGDGGDWESFKAQNPELLRKDALLAYYPKSVLESAEARARFVLLPLSQRGSGS